jgi:hypothetical protein
MAEVFQASGVEVEQSGHPEWSAESGIVSGLRLPIKMVRLTVSEAGW